MIEPNGSSEPPDQSRTGLTRREALKKGAILGGALIWTTPLIQAIGIQPASAQEASSACEVRVESFPGGPIICLQYPAELCECLAACGPDPTDECVAECFAAFDPIGTC